jgi:site-specific DNA recombinase
MYRTRNVEPQKSPKVKRYRHDKNSSKAARPQEDWIAIPVTPIIDTQIWEAAQERLKLNATHSKRNNTKNEYLLRGLVVCGLCGSFASGTVSNKSVNYSCGARRHRNITTRPHDERIAIPRPVLDKKVWDGLTNLLDDPASLQAQLEARMEKQNIHALIPLSDEKYQKELEKLDFQEKRILDAYRESAINLDELKEQKAKIASNRKVLEAKIKAAQSQQESSRQPEITMEMLGDVSDRYHRVMAKADFSTRVKIVNLLVNSVTLFQNRAVVEGIIPVTPVDALIPSNLGTT